MPDRKQNVAGPIPHGSRLAAAGLAAAAVIGLLLRIAFLADKPFWRDEAWVAWVVELPPAARPGVQHVSPIGFLAAVRAIAALLPWMSPEIAYRLVPMAAGVASMLLLPLLARRLGAPTAAVASTAWLAAGMPALVYYSRELKPYALDILWAAVLLLITSDQDGAGEPGWRGRWLSLLALAAAAPWVSYGAVFPTAAALVWVGWRSMRAVRRRIVVPAALVAVAVFAAAVTLAYAHYLRQQIAHPLLPLMWDDALRPGVSFGPAAARRMADAVRLPLPYLFPAVWPLAAVLAVIGAAALPSRGRGAVLWCWLGSAALAGGCAAANLYVVAHGRFLLFLAPPVIVCVATGLARCCDLALHRLGRRAAAGAAVVLSAAWAVAWGAQSLQRRLPPDTARPRPFVFDVIQDVPALVSWLDAQRVPPSMLLVGRYAADPFRYYSRGRLDGARLMGFGGHGYGAEFTAWLAGRREGWLLLVSEEAGSYRRTLSGAAFHIREVAAARGAVVWYVTREASPQRTPQGTRDGVGAPSGSGT